MDEFGGVCFGGCGGGGKLRVHSQLLPKTADKYFTVSIPCKAYIAKYVKFLHGSKVIRADQYTTVGFCVKMCLEKKVYESRNISNSACHRGMDDSITIQINRFLYIGVGFGINTESILQINKFLEQQFQEALFVHCSAHMRATSYNQGYKEALESLIMTTAKDVKAGLAEAPGVLRYDIISDPFHQMVLDAYNNAARKTSSVYQGYKEAIEGFCTKMGIDLEYDISYEGLKKMEYRYRTKKDSPQTEVKKGSLFS